MIGLALTVALWATPSPQERPNDPALGDGATLSMPVDWLERPSAEDMERVFPHETGQAFGLVRLDCHLRPDGRLGSCSVTEEPQFGRGFADAARQLLPLFRARPVTRTTDGISDPRVTFHLYFGAAGHCIPPICVENLPAPPPPPGFSRIAPVLDDPARTRPKEPTPPAQSIPDPVTGLGVTFDRVAGQEFRPCEDGTPRCVILFDPAVPDFMQELLTVEVHDGPLDVVAADQAGFVRDTDGRLMTTYGRFEPVEVEAFEVNGNPGLRATIACGISDPDTGFHAGAGECLWVVISDGTRSILISTRGFENGFDAAEAIIASLRFERR